MNEILERIKIIAKTVPAIMIVLGFIAVFLFHQSSGWILIVLGVVLQVLYLVLKYRQ